MKVYISMIFILFASINASAVSFNDPIGSAMLQSDFATNVTDRSIDVPVGTEIKLAYRENPASLASIVKWTVSTTPGTGLETLYTEDFMGGKITRFLSKEAGVFKIHLTALDDSQIIRTRDFTVNVSKSSDASSEDNSTVDMPAHIAELEKESGSQNGSKTMNSTNGSSIVQRNSNDSVNATHMPDSEIAKMQIVPESSSDSGFGTFVLFMLVLVSAMYILRKKGIA